ncbi:hypothetical protein GX586_11805 [bacterium]|nr:hypothetical protein [bacterium]
MNIDFSPRRWQSVKEHYRAWWAGELERPLLAVTLNGRDAGRPAPALPYHGFTAFYGLDTPAEQIVDRWTYQLETQKFLGDAFPSMWPNYGAGAIAAFLGAELHNTEHTVWFRPRAVRDIRDISFAYDPENPWFRRVKEVVRAAVGQWHGRVQTSMTDLGGNLDVLSSFRPGENLLLDLYDHPDEVKRLTWEAHGLWFRYFDEINACLQPANPGYTAWTPIFSDEPYYMLQCDFCYMISPAMLDEFVKPELAAACARIANPFYHLDGPGQIPHLDSLLEIKELKGVQWIPGDGQPGIGHWPQIYRKIIAAGKRAQLFGYGKWADIERTFDTIVQQVGSAKGLILIAGAEVKDEAAVMRFLERYGQ